MEKLASEQLEQAVLYINGAKLEGVGQGDARNRFAKAFQQLITVSFPNLRMLKGTYDDAMLSKALLEQDDLLTGGVLAPSEPEKEILSYVTQNQNNGDRTSVEEIIKNFGRRPYGWYPLAVQYLLARLFRMGKVEIRIAEVLDSRGVLANVRNSRQWGSMRVRLQEQFDATKVNALKSFHFAFFDKQNSGNDARAVGQATAEAFSADARELNSLVEQSTRYPFLSALKPLADRITKISQKDYTYLLTNLSEYEADLLAAKENVIAPIKTFMRGPQRVIYDDVLTFLRAEEANFIELPAAEVQPLRDLAASDHPYRGDSLPLAKAAVTRVRRLLTELLDSERVKAVETLAAHEARLETIPDFAGLSASSRSQVIAATVSARENIQSFRFVSGIRDRVQRYVTHEYPAQVALADRLAAPSPLPLPPIAPPVSGQPPRPPVPQPPAPRPAVEYIPASTLKANCKLPYISTVAELDQWLDALRAAAKDELDKGNRITL